MSEFDTIMSYNSGNTPEQHILGILNDRVFTSLSNRIVPEDLNNVHADSQYKDGVEQNYVAVEFRSTLPDDREKKAELREVARYFSQETGLKFEVTPHPLFNYMMVAYKAEGLMNVINVSMKIEAMNIGDKSLWHLNPKEAQGKHGYDNTLGELLYDLESKGFYTKTNEPGTIVFETYEIIVELESAKNQPIKLENLRAMLYDETGAFFEVKEVKGNTALVASGMDSRNADIVLNQLREKDILVINHPKTRQRIHEEERKVHDINKRRDLRDEAPTMFPDDGTPPEEKKGITLSLDKDFIDSMPPKNPPSLSLDKDFFKVVEQENLSKKSQEITPLTINDVTFKAVQKDGNYRIAVASGIDARELGKETVMAAVLASLNANELGVTFENQGSQILLRGDVIDQKAAKHFLKGLEASGMNVEKMGKTTTPEGVRSQQPSGDRGRG